MKIEYTTYTSLWKCQNDRRQKCNFFSKQLKTSAVRISIILNGYNSSHSLLLTFNQLVYVLSGATMFQYYIKIVPTVYAKLDTTTTFTNQFSVTRHQKGVAISNGETGMPGIFFSYELSPLMVKYTEKERQV